MLQQMMKEENALDSMIRLSIRGLGWGGPNFGMSLEETKEEHDKLVEVDGFRFVIDPQAQNHLNNITIDYRSSLLGKGFVISNGGSGGGCC